MLILPFSDWVGRHEVARVSRLATREVRLAVHELVEARAVVDVRFVDPDVDIKLASGEPRSSEVARQLARWLDVLVRQFC